jgi:hypothetical protein
LSLAFGSKGLEHQGAFDKLIGILASNKPQVVYGGQTGPQSSTNGLPLALSKPYGQGDGNEDVMIKEAEKRAAGKR